MLSIPGITPRKNDTARLKDIDCQKARTIRNSKGIIAILCTHPYQCVMWPNLSLMQHMLS